MQGSCFAVHSFSIAILSTNSRIFFRNKTTMKHAHLLSIIIEWPYLVETIRRLDTKVPLGRLEALLQLLLVVVRLLMLTMKWASSALETLKCSNRMQQLLLTSEIKTIFLIQCILLCLSVTISTSQPNPVEIVHHERFS